MCSNNVLKEPAPKKPNFEEYSLRFHKFVQKVSQLPLDYSKAYLSLFDQIKPQKCLSRAVPTIEEIHQGFQIFLSRLFFF